MTDPSRLEVGVVALNGGGDRARIRALIATLPDRQLLVLFLRHYAGLDDATIARALDATPGTVAATLNASRERLHAQLEEVHEWKL